METGGISQEDLEILLENSLRVLRKYDYILDSYVLDFYIDDHWSKLPSSWKNLLGHLEPEKLGRLLDPQEKLGDTLWPLEIIALKKVLNMLNIDRNTRKVEGLPKSSPLLDHPKLKHLFDKNVKPKKRMEKNQMALICKQSVDETQVDFVIDFGAGIGHLARVLGYAYGIKVCCLEKEAQLNEQASEIDLNVESMAGKYLGLRKEQQLKSPDHVTLCLDAEMQAEEFLAGIKEALGLTRNDFTFGIIGLHPCGDLGPILMKLFLKCPQAKFLNFVGCCYMKLTTCHSSNMNGNYGYPLSRYLKKKSLTFSVLSYEAREISCHAIETYCDRLKAKDYEHLKVHSYRAAAERLICKYDPKLKHSGLRSVKFVPGLTFQEYFYKACSNLPVRNMLPEELNSAMTQKDLESWQNIVIFYSLRLLLAPLVESIILYDRMLFLLENDCSVDIKAIFNPRLSPRNHITIGMKNR